MRILITGGAGYVGSELVYSLCQDQEVEELIIYDNLFRGNFNMFTGHRKLERKVVRFVEADILDSRSLRKHLDGVDVVIHLAANVTTPFADQRPHLMEQVNHWGTAELVNALEHVGPVPLIHLSSTSVYGANIEVKSTQDTLNPRTFYGISKMHAEEQVRRLYEKTPVQILRCANIFGYSKNMRFDAVVNRFMFDAHFKGRIRVNGSGTQRRSFVNIKRLCKAIRYLIDQKESGLYNLSEHHLSIEDLANLVNDLYPDMERIYINQNMPMREQVIEADPIFAEVLGEPGKMSDELLEFVDCFTF